MKYLKIQNRGELDIRLISLMGGTTKFGNSYKIGRFGTGLKYSLSYLVRNNIDFKIFVGEKEVPVETRRENIQGVDFDILYINGERSSITSSMGVDWLGWMIVRELWCNAKDEGEEKRGYVEECFGVEGATTFFIQLTGEIKDTVDNWDKYFIHEQLPMFESEVFALYPASDKFRIYKQGVLIYEEKKDRAVFSYDIKNASINELREYTGILSFDLLNIIASLDRNNAEYFLSNIKEECYEWNMDYDWSKEFSDGWKEAIGQAKVIAKQDYDSFKNRWIKMDEDSFIVVPQGLHKKLATKFPSISAVRRSDKINSFYETFDSELESKIKSAVVILGHAGYSINPELKFIYGVFGDPMVFAKVNIDEKIVMFSEELKRGSMFNIISTIIEENEHFLTGFEDCTRKFQQHFIDLYTKGILEKAEVTI